MIPQRSRVLNRSYTALPPPTQAGLIGRKYPYCGTGIIACRAKRSGHIAYHEGAPVATSIAARLPLAVCCDVASQRSQLIMAVRV